MKPAAWPRFTLGCERCTLTHSVNGCWVGVAEVLGEAEDDAGADAEADAEGSG